MWDAIVDWLLSLGDEYGVDPLVYAVIYVGAAPLFFGSLAWLISGLRRGRPVALPLASAAFFFSAPTLYVFIVGRNLPPWVYGLLAALAIFGAITTVRRVRRQLRQASAVTDGEPRTDA